MKQLNRLSEVFKEKGVSNRLISSHLSKTEETISRWVNNHRQPSVEDLNRIAHFLQIDIRSLLIPTSLNNAQEAPYLYLKKKMIKQKKGLTWKKRT